MCLEISFWNLSNIVSPCMCINNMQSLRRQARKRSWEALWKSIFFPSPAPVTSSASRKYPTSNEFLISFRAAIILHSLWTLFRALPWKCTRAYNCCFVSPQPAKHFSSLYLVRNETKAERRRCKYNRRSEKIESLDRAIELLKQCKCYERPRSRLIGNSTLRLSICTFPFFLPAWSWESHEFFQPNEYLSKAFKARRLNKR